MALWPTQQAVITTDDLAGQLRHRDLVVLLTKIKDPFKGDYPDIPEQLIPGTRVVDLESAASDENAKFPHTLPDGRAFSRLLASLGIKRDSHVVIYDLKGIFGAARLWWMLKACGLDTVWVLNGGLERWHGDTLPLAALSDIEVPSEPMCEDRCDYAKGAFSGTQKVLSELDHPTGIQLIDARSEARFLGQVDEPRKGLRRGHIPGAVNLPFTDVLTAGGLRCDRELRALFMDRGISSSTSVIAYCGSGVTACILLLAAYQIGMTNLSVYDGSWSEWGATPALPLAT